MRQGARRAAIAALALGLAGAGAAAQVPSPSPVPALLPSPAPNLTPAPPASPAGAAAQPQFEAASPAPPSTDCGDQGGLYLGPKNLKLWVTRKGIMTRDNPLRPLTGEQLAILQVVVNGHLASAYGPDFDNLHRGGPPQALQADGAKIAWEDKADGLPRAIRVVADDGTVVLGPVPFQQCEEAPKVAAPVVAAKKAGPAKRKPAGAPRAPSGLALPQGALPPGGLPQGAIP